MTVTQDYAPGRCNIGADEIRRRRMSGHIGAAAFAVALVVLVVLDASPVWYLLLFIPAFLATSGYVQAAYRFCYYFGFTSVFNFGEVGKMQKIANDASQAQDRARAYRVVGTSALIALGITLIPFGLAISAG